MKIPKQLSIKQVTIFCVTIAVLFIVYCVVSPPENVQWTGFKKDTETSRSRKVIRNGKEITTVTKDVSGKTLWDWMSVLGVPLSLAALGFYFQQQQQKIADNDQKEEVLQAYFDRLSTLLVDKNLIAIATKLKKANEAKNEQGEVVAGDQDATLDEQKELLGAAVDVIRARTLSILRRLGEDGERKSSVIRFLLEAEVIDKLSLKLSSANLSGANLIGAGLSFTDLYGANLSSANLSRADLSNADLNGANLSNANLSLADLSGAYLIGADLSNANPSFADLSGAYLSGADLSNASLSNTNLSSANLSDANLNGASLYRAKLSRANLEDITWDEDTQWAGAKNLETVVNMPEELKQQLRLVEKAGE
jgi:uncharacterized protein YjbI with pentapeptide repeats